MIELLLNSALKTIRKTNSLGEGAKRKELFRKHPPKYIYVFRNRMATWKNGFEKNPDTGKKWAETICFAWFVWVKGNQSEPVVRWVD